METRNNGVHTQATARASVPPAVPICDIAVTLENTTRVILADSSGGPRITLAVSRYKRICSQQLQMLAIHVLKRALHGICHIGTEEGNTRRIVN